MILGWSLSRAFHRLAVEVATYDVTPLDCGEALSDDARQGIAEGPMVSTNVYILDTSSLTVPFASTIHVDTTL